jgi:hypothetical protein
MGFDSGFYDVQQARRFRQSILLFIILATLPCYCVGAILLGVAPGEEESDNPPATTLPAPGIQTAQARNTITPPRPATATLFPSQNPNPLAPTPGQFIPASSTPVRILSTPTLAPTLTLASTATPTATATNTLTITPTATLGVNQNPAFTLPPVDITFDVGNTTNVGFSFSDPEGDPVTFTATSNNPAVAVITSLGQSDFNVQGVSAGSTTITVVLQDNRGGSASATINVTVNALPVTNNNPAFGSNPSPVSLIVGDVVPVLLQFSDPDGDLVTFTASSANGGIATIVTSDPSSITVQAVAAGSTTITVTLNDGRGGSATLNITVNVS